MGVGNGLCYLLIFFLGNGVLVMYGSKYFGLLILGWKMV